MKGCKVRIASLALDGPIKVSCSDVEGCLRRMIEEGKYVVEKGEVLEGNCYIEEGPQGQRSEFERHVMARQEREIFHI